MAFLNILQKYKLDFRFKKTNFRISMGFISDFAEIKFCFKIFDNICLLM